MIEYNHCSIFLPFLFIILPLNFAVDGIGSDGPMNLISSSSTTQQHVSSNGPTTVQQLDKVIDEEEPKSANIVKQFFNFSKILANRKKSENSKTQTFGNVKNEIDELNELQKTPTKVTNVGTDQMKDLSPFSDQKSPISFDHPPTLSTQSSHDAEEVISFADYWKSVQKLFTKNSESQNFVSKVPPKIIAKIFLQMINAFLNDNKINGKTDQKEKTFKDFPHPQNFTVHRKSAITEQIVENKLGGDVRFEYADNVPKRFRLYDFFYKSPEQIKNKSSEFDQLSIVWTFGVIMYELLTNGQHPFEGLKEQLVAEDEHYKNIDIQKLTMHYPIYVDKSGQMWGKGKDLGENLEKAIDELMEKGEEVPIPYEQTMPSELAICGDIKEGDEEGEEGGDDQHQYVCVNEYEPLINITRQCLQTYKKNRLTMGELCEKLEEIARTNNKTFK